MADPKANPKEEPIEKEEGASNAPPVKRSPPWDYFQMGIDENGKDQFERN